MTNKDEVIPVAVSLVEGFAQAFEQEAERTFTGAQVAESLRAAAERAEEELEKRFEELSS